MTDAERARVAVTKAIGRALTRIEQVDAGVADHLRARVRTGVVCVFAEPVSMRTSAAGYARVSSSTGMVRTPAVRRAYSAKSG